MEPHLNMLLLMQSLVVECAEGRDPPENLCREFRITDADERAAENEGRHRKEDTEAPVATREPSDMEN
ncbi:MAG: hypothetical protein ACI9C1_003502 [Candidatus Aldehydirespiratoraceae bacterium]